MKLSTKFEPLILVLTTLVLIGTQAVSVDILRSLATNTIESSTVAAENSLPDYLISRTDIDRVLSKVIKPTGQIAVISDFDGTLGEIQPDPSQTSINPASKAAIQQLVQRTNVFTAIVSGRPMYDVRNRVGFNNITYSGNHGMEILFINQTEYHYPITPVMYENCRQLKALLIEKYGHEVYGAFVEDKNISLVYHYTNVSFDVREKVLAEITELVIQHGFIPVPSHGSIEIKPPVVWSKGHAILLILDEVFGKDWHERVHVIFMGDDTSDEDAMRLLKGKGTSFRVTKKTDIKSHATYKMQSVATATFILEWIANNTILA